MNSGRRLKKSILFSISFSFLLTLTLALTACKNSVMLTQPPADSKAYLVVSVKEAEPSRRVTSQITSALFSDITFSGTDQEGHTVSKNAATFAALAQEKIYVDTGTWTFTLEAYLGKTSTFAGEKYVATNSGVVINPGENHLSMKLQVDPASLASPSAHPGSWEVTIQFPSDSIDEVELSLFDYSAFAVEGSNLSGLTPLFTKTFVKETDYTASGAQTLTASESSRASGNYVISVAFNAKLRRVDGTSQKELLNNWVELMRISPGAKARGSISLPSSDEVYTITYHNGSGAEWDTSSSVSIPLSYTKRSGDSNGKIILPGASAFVARQYYDFLGWYENEAFTGTPITDFNVSDARPKHFYAKWKEPVYDVYISASGNDTTGDGSKDKPLKTANAAYALFDDLSAVNADGTFKNTIHIISDYTGSQKITDPWGDGSKNGMCVNFVGEKGSVADTAVTLELDMHNCGNPPGPQTFIYIEHDQKMKFSHINFTSNQTHENPNGFGCLFADDDTELYFEDSTIKGYVANGCAAINAEGTVYLKNCEISGNKAINANLSGIWGCAVNVGTGRLHISGSVIIKGNQILKADASGQLESESYNLYLGTDDGGSLVLHPVIIDDEITGSEIWVKLAREPQAFTSDYSSHESVIPSTYFHSDSGMDIVLDSISGEAELSKSFVVYVSSDASSPAGSDTTGNGTSSKPFASIDKAISKISSFNDSDIDAKVLVTGNIPCNVTIDDDGSFGTKLVAKTLTIQGTGVSSGEDWKTGAAQTVLNGDITGTGQENGSVIEMSAPVPLTLKNLTIKNGKTAYNGGALCYDGTKTVVIDSCIIQNNEAQNNGGALYFANSEVSLHYTEITNNKVTGTGTNLGQGGALYLSGGALSFMSSTSFKSNFAARYGGAISVVNSGQVIMTGGTIEGNGALTQGGGVYIADTASFTMNGTDSFIKDNGVIGPRPETGVTPQNKTAGGGVCVAQGGSFTMNNGQLSGNYGRTGAGLCVMGTATLNDGLITSNKKTESLGNNYDLASLTCAQLSTYLSNALNDYKGIANVEVGIPGTFNMKGGTITQASDTHSGMNGAAVNIYARSVDGDSAGNATFNMTGGTITGLKGGQNGVVALNVNVSGGQAIFTMSGGSITNNESADRGTIRLVSNGYFTMTGGEISGNHAATDTGAIYGSYSSITLGQAGSESTIIIKDNTAGISHAVSNLCLPDNGKITVAGPLSTESQIGISRSYSNTPFTTGYADTNSGRAPKDIFTSDEGYAVIEGADGEAAFTINNNGTVYLPSDYVFTFSANKNYLTQGVSAAVTVTPTVKRKEPNGNQTDLYYKASDQKLYLDSAFTLPAAGDNTVSWSASLLCGPSVEYDTLTTDSGSNANTFTIPALTYEDTYILHVLSTYMGYTSDASFNLQCKDLSESITTPLTLEAIEAGAVVTFNNNASGPVTYRVNSGAEQTIANGASKNITLSAVGDKVQFFGNNAVYAPSGINSSSIACSKDCYVYGNIMSLVNSTNFAIETELTADYAFSHFFENNTNIKNKTGSALLLPAITLTRGCYSYMFSGCSSLSTAPELPATGLAYNCYQGMFSSCAALTTAPSLPATILAENCYGNMFQNCTGLVNAPILPATTMVKNCYNSMFEGCTSLIQAPDLPAVTLEFGCYYHMFIYCSSLNSVTCLATDISATACVTQWLLNVAPNGTFTKAAGMSSWPRSEYGIPSGWTVNNY